MAVACWVSALRQVLLPAFISPKRPMTGRGTVVVDEEEEEKESARRRQRRGCMCGGGLCVWCGSSGWLRSRSAAGRSMRADLHFKLT